MKPSKKRYFIFFKGKLYKFKSFDNQLNKCKVLNLNYCQMDFISIQKPNQTVAFGSKFGRGPNAANLNLEQCIVIRFLHKAIILTSHNGMKDGMNANSGNTPLKKWFGLLKYFGVMQNLRCHYDVGNIIGKGNFAKVYEIMHSATKRKFALKTISKEMFKDNIKSILSLHDEINLLRKIRHPNVL